MTEELHQIRLVGVTGSGAIGTDPWHMDTWSGSSRRFFMQCRRSGMLHRAFGVEAPGHLKSLYQLLNFSCSKMKWKRQFYMDERYRNCLTREIARRIEAEDLDCSFLQVGSMFNVAEVVRGRSRCYSYNDGNFMMSLQSPYFPARVERSRIDRTLKYEIEVVGGLDHVFTMSEFLRQSYIKDYGLARDKVTCIGAGINLDSLPPLASDKDYSRKNLLFIGVDFERKGGPQLLQAFRLVKSRFPDAVLNIVGGKPAGTTNVAGVQWHGILSKSSPKEAAVLYRLLQDSTLFVMPSIYEPFGIAPLEAMSYQIPCVVTRAWALPEIVPDKVCGRLVSTRDVEELAETMTSILSDPSELKRCGENGRRHVEESFTWEKVVQRLHKILSE